MGLIDALARMLGFRTQAAQPQTAAGASGGTPSADPAAAPSRTAEPASPARPVAIDLHEEDDLDADVLEPVPADAAESEREPLQALGPPPKNRQQLVEELRKNYTEVLGLVRKVDDHLDEQQRRGQRLLELAEQSARQMDRLPELVEHNARIAESIARLVEITREGAERSEASADRVAKNAIQQLESMQRQTAAIQQMQGAIARSAEQDERMAGTIDGFRQSLSGMASATDRLGETVSTLREGDAERERELAQLVARGQRVTNVMVAVMGLLAIGVLVFLVMQLA